MFCCLWPLLFLGFCGNDRNCRRDCDCRREERRDRCCPIDFPRMNIHRGFDEDHHCHRD